MASAGHVNEYKLNTNLAGLKAQDLTENSGWATFL
jgi:hypothetical protein